MSQQKGGSLVRDKLAGDVLVLPHSCYRYVRGRELHSFRTDSPYFETFPSYEYIRNTCNFTLVRPLSRASTFRTRRRERRKGKRRRREEGREYCIARARPKFVHRFDVSKRSELGLRDRTAEEKAGKRGSSTFFATL